MYICTIIDVVVVVVFCKRPCRVRLQTPVLTSVVSSGGRIFGNRIQSNDYFEVIGVTDYRSQKEIVTKYPDPFIRPDAAD